MSDDKIKEKQEELKRMISEFSDEYLNNEYKSLNLKLLNKLIENNVSFNRGRVENWACGIIFAIGQLNFLFERSITPYVSHNRVCGYFETRKETAWIKSRDIRRLLNLKLGDEELSTEFTLSLNIPKSDEDLKRIRTFEEVKFQISDKHPGNAVNVENNELLDSIHKKSIDLLKLRSTYFLRIFTDNQILVMSADDDKFYIPLFTDVSKCKELLKQFDNSKPRIWPFYNILDYIDNDNFIGVIVNPDIDHYLISKEMIKEVYPNYEENNYFHIFFCNR